MLLIIVGMSFIGVSALTGSVCYYFYLKSGDTKGGGGSRRRFIHEAKLEKARLEKARMLV